MFKHKKIWIIIYAAALFAFTLYLCLDTFVIARVYTPAQQVGVVFSEEVTEAQVAQHIKESETTASEETYAETSAAAEDVSITLTEYYEYGTVIYVADVTVSSPEYLKTALAQGVYGRNIKAATSEIAEENDAVLAINGDFYGSQERGYVIRNGVLYRDTPAGREDLVIYTDGSFEIINEAEVSAQQLLAGGAWQVLSFGPALLSDGGITVDEGDEVGKAMASNPRTAIAVLDDLHYLFIVSDGRTNESAGLSLYELAEFIQSLGAETAYNLDGGGSSTMYYNGEVINNPTTSGRNVSERSVSDIVYIG